MALIKRKAEFKIGNYIATVDAEDLPRLEQRQWNLTGGVLPYTDVGTPGNPMFLPLPNFLLNLGNDVFVEHKDSDHTNYRKSNLRATR